jgi:hypothetical protein
LAIFQYNTILKRHDFLNAPIMKCALRVVINTRETKQVRKLHGVGFSPLVGFSQTKLPPPANHLHPETNQVCARTLALIAPNMRKLATAIINMLNLCRHTANWHAIRALTVQVNQYFL